MKELKNYYNLDETPSMHYKGTSRREEYEDYLKRHVDAVENLLNMLTEYLELDRHFSNHDASKWFGQQFDAYLDYFYPANEDMRNDPATKMKFKYAWLEHQNCEEHHWQYWVLINDKDGIEALQMPTNYVLEMVCDWGSFAYIKQDGNELIKWYESHKDKMMLHDATRALVEELVPIVAGLIDEHLNGGN